MHCAPIALTSELIGVSRPENSGIPAPIETDGNQKYRADQYAAQTTDHW
jgi:hypothetical protein